VAIALGPGVNGAYWKTAKPYQPTSPHWQARVVGCSGAVWIDADRDGRKTPAREYAERLADTSGGDVAKLVAGLADYDEAVAAQAAHVYRDRGGDLRSAAAQAAIANAAPATQAGFRRYLESWRRSEIARVQE
jgi:hypothetical protein